MSSNYRFGLAPLTWDFIRAVRGGTAIFTMPAGPIKCGGAPQKIAHLAADSRRRQCLLDTIRVILLPTPAILSQPDWAKVLTRITVGHGIEVHYNSHLVEVDGESRRAVILDNAPGTRETTDYELLHAPPTQSAPDWLMGVPLADPASPYGYPAADQHTLQSTRRPDVFALGDVANLPTSKTGAAIRKQAPVVATNLLAPRRGEPLAAHYDGHTSCPLATAHNRMLLAEFDY